MLGMLVLVLCSPFPYQFASVRLTCFHVLWAQPRVEDMGHGVKGLIVGASNEGPLGCGFIPIHCGKLLVDAGSDGLFLFTTPKLPELPPRMLTALRHSQKCLT